MRGRACHGSGRACSPTSTPRSGTEFFRRAPGPFGLVLGVLPRGLTSPPPRDVTVGAPEVTEPRRRQRPGVPPAWAPPHAPSPLATATAVPRSPRPAPEELLQAGVAEAVAAGRNLHRLAHGLPAQRAQQPPLGLLQELVVEAGHGGRAGERRARASGAGHAAAPQPAPRSGRAPGSGRRRLAAAACAQAPEPARRKRGWSRARAVLAPTAPSSHPPRGLAASGSADRQPGALHRARAPLSFSEEIVAPLLPGAGGALTLDGPEGPGGRAGPRHKGSLLQSQQLGLGGPRVAPVPGTPACRC